MLKELQIGSSILQFLHLKLALFEGQLTVNNHCRVGYLFATNAREISLASWLPQYARYLGIRPLDGFKENIVPRYLIDSSIPAEQSQITTCCKKKKKKRKNWRNSSVKHAVKGVAQPVFAAAVCVYRRNMRHKTCKRSRRTEQREG